MYYKIASLVLNSGQKATSIADVFIAQPDTAKEALVGKLFILAEIESQKNEAAKILDFLINNLNYNYYQNEKVILKERIETISIENIFESALAKTNKDLVEFLGHEKIKISPYAFNLTVCILYKNELYFSGVGKNKNFLIYKEKVAPPTVRGRVAGETEKIEYKIADLNKQREGENEGLVITKLFSEVLSGKIPVNGFFFVVNEALSEYLSAKQLIDIITKLSPAGAVEQIRNLLEKINSYVSFLGIIVKNTAGANLSNEELKKKIEEEIKNWDYRPEIVATEEKTEAILTPAGAVNFKRWFKLLSDKFKPKRRTSAPAPMPLGQRAGKIFLLKDKIFVKRRDSAFSAEKFLVFFQRLGAFLAQIFHNLFKPKNQGAKDGSKPAIAGIETKSEKTLLSGKKAKVFLVAGLVLIIAFAASIFITNRQNAQDKKLAIFNSTLSEINKNQDTIDAWLLYGNENESKELWARDQSLLAGISEEDKKGRSDIENLIKRQGDQLEKLRKVTVVSDLKKIADFSNLNSSAAPVNLTLFEDKLYAADPAGKALYKIDLKENLVTAVYDLGDISEMKYPSPTADGLFYLDRNSMLLVNKENKAQKIAIEAAPEDIGGAGIYNNRLYLIDKKNGQVRRYTNTGEKFSGQSEWLEKASDFSSVTDVFIDGNIYVLKKDGQAEKYLKGKKEDFSLAAVDEPISAASRLIAGEKHVYVFEPSKKRLVVFDEKGKFLGQYLFSGLENITDFAAAESTGKIYLLSGPSVYEITIN